MWIKRYETNKKIYIPPGINKFNLLVFFILAHNLDPPRSLTDTHGHVSVNRRSSLRNEDVATVGS